MSAFNKAKRAVVVATTQELLNLHYSRRLWIAVKNHHPKISRRKWLGVLAEVLYDFKGQILISVNGYAHQYPIPEIDNVFDADGRWISYYLEEVDGLQRRKIKVLERLRLFDLYFRIAKPHIAAHFGK